jgi:hypothetical protein
MQQENNGAASQLRSPQQIISGEKIPPAQSQVSMFEVSCSCIIIIMILRNTSSPGSERKRFSRD